MRDLNLPAGGEARMAESQQRMSKGDNLSAINTHSLPVSKLADLETIQNFLTCSRKLIIHRLMTYMRTSSVWESLISEFFSFQRSFIHFRH